MVFGYLLHGKWVIYVTKQVLGHVYCRTNHNWSLLCFEIDAAASFIADLIIVHALCCSVWCIVHSC